MADPVAERRRRRAGIRVRTTLAAVAVVALALVIAGIGLVLLVRANLADNLADTAQTRAEATAAQIEASGPPRSAAVDPSDPPSADDEPEDTFTEVHGPDGTLISTTDDDYRLPGHLVGASRDHVSIGEDNQPFVLHSERAEWADSDYIVTVGISLDDLHDTTAALVPPLAVGIPALLGIVALTTWFVVGGALRPVDRMRAEVDTITDDRLDRRVPEPGSRDEIGRLAATMNRMLSRLERSRAQQQRFVSDASHELRSPVATLRQSAEVQAAHPDAFEPGEFAQIVVDESVRMERLVEQMLLLTRADEGRRTAETEVDLDDLALAEAARVRRATPLEVDTSGIGPARILGDPVAWSQVLRNLVDNAARHASSRVGVSVSGGADDGDGTSTRTAPVVVHVDDDGAGIAPADRESVFERFVRLDDARTRDAGGSGLGLAIVRDLVTAAGGTVVVTESPWGGARFTLTIGGRDAV